MFLRCGFNLGNCKFLILIKCSDSIAGIRGYKYLRTNYRRFVLQEFYSFDRKGDVASKENVYFMYRSKLLIPGFQTFYWSDRTASPLLIQ